MRRDSPATWGGALDDDSGLTGPHDGLLTFPVDVGFGRWLPSRRHILKTYSDFT